MARAPVKEAFASLNVKRVQRICKQDKMGRMKRCRKERAGKMVPFSSERPNNERALASASTLA